MTAIDLLSARTLCFIAFFKISSAAAAASDVRAGSVVCPPVVLGHTTIHTANYSHFLRSPARRKPRGASATCRGTLQLNSGPYGLAFHIIADYNDAISGRCLECRSRVWVTRKWTWCCVGFRRAYITARARFMAISSCTPARGLVH